MQFSDEIIKVIDNLCEKFGVAIDWTSQNVVSYLQQVGQRVVNYEIGTSIVWLVVGLIALIIGIGCFVYLNKTEDYDTVGICFFFGIILSAVGVIMIITQTLDIVTAYTLPEKVIYNQLYDVYLRVK
jgi:hypothetical protein